MTRATPGDVFRYFFRLGFIAFGGPAAHIALMRRELVRDRRWLNDGDFMDMLGVTNLIPGPNSTEMTMGIGARMAGWRGLWLGGLGFIGPAVAIVLVLAWAYVGWGTTPAGQGIILGIQPFILAIIVQAIWGLRGAAFKGPATMVVGLAAIAFSLLDVSEVFIILGAGAAMLLWRLGRRQGGPPPGRGVVAKDRSRVRLPGRLRAVLPLPLPFAPVLSASTPAGYSLLELFLVFLKIGAVLYGSGYVLLAFLETELVDDRGWLTEQQLLDAIAAGQFTPGPLFSSATFAGYIIDGLPGAMVATAGIFLPSFVFVSVVHPFLPKLRDLPWASAFLDGVNVAALALMGVVTVVLGREVLDDWYAAGLFAIAAVVLIRWSPNSAWLVLAGAAAGLLHEWAW